MQVDKPVALHISVFKSFPLLFFSPFSTSARSSVRVYSIPHQCIHMYIYDHTTTVARESRLSALVIEAVSAVYIYSKLSHTHKQQISREGGPQPQILVRLNCEKGKPE